MTTSINFPMIASIAAIIIAQTVKYPIALLTRKENASVSLIHATGGMPSSHSAACSSLITALIFQHGFISPYVAIALCFGMIVMFDAMGVRRQSGEQGLLLVQLMTILRDKAKRDNDIDLLTQLNQIDEKQKIIDDYLGHKPSEVVGGIFTGFFVALSLRILFSYFNLFL